MGILERLLGKGGGRTSSAETETVRRIAARLERLPHERARHLAAFAYVLARVANADLRITDSETDSMLEIVRTNASLSPEEAALVVEIAKSQARLFGGTENYVVTREFREISTPEERLQLLECLFAVAAADGTIDGGETSEIDRVGEELGFARHEVLSMRAGWRDKIGALRGLPGRS